MPTEARNAEQDMMGVQGEGGGTTNGFHDHQLPDSPVSHDDGYFTSAVSVQHKVGHEKILVSLKDIQQWLYHYFQSNARKILK